MRGDRSGGSNNPFPDEYDGPTVDIPQVDAPSVDVPTASADSVSDSTLSTLFVFHVLLWNAVLLSLSLGAMLIYFRQDWTNGTRAIAVGVILTAYGIYRWPSDDDE